jgi:hypothetical protein
MGAWGAKLYEDDTALDVKDRFDDLRQGKTVEEITKELIDEYACVMDDNYCAPTFWFALADTQWNLGRLLPEVKEQALAWLDKGVDLAVWKEENPTLAVTREKVLRELRQKLNSSQPPEKKISKNKIYRCEWKVGDVYAYQLDSDYAKEKGVYGRYFLFHKIGEGIWHPGHIVPIVRVKITGGNQLPPDENTFNKLEYVQTSATNYEDRFLPFDARYPIEDQIAEKSKIEYQVDEFGFLPQYRVKLINTSKRIIPNKISFLANYQNVISPSNEFIPHDEMNVQGFIWKFFDKIMIDRYCGYNLRQFKIYQTN